jgi:hypothetical protein
MNASRLIRLVAVSVVMAAALFGLSACGASPVTRARLERSLPQSFANQYVLQAAILGHKGVTVGSLTPRAQCDKGGPKVADRGLGADWVCFMDWKDPNVPVVDGSAKFELNVHSNNCYTATGPTKLIGLRTITDTHGTFVDNPVFEFDTCFDPGSSDATTHVVFPPASLELPSGTVKPDGRGVISPALSCTVGPLGCSGTITARLGSRSLGKTTYSLAPGGASATRFAVHSGESGKLTLVAAPTVGGVTRRTAVLNVPEL